MVIILLGTFLATMSGLLLLASRDIAMSVIDDS
jgi:hypothetical protein